MLCLYTLIIRFLLKLKGFKIVDRQYWSGVFVKHLKPNEVFIFGSNAQGRHGAGAAKAALSFGAKYGVGRGLQGQSYALITKNLKEGFKEKATGIVYNKEGYRSVSRKQIESNIKELYKLAKKWPERLFYCPYKYETYASGAPKKSLNGYNCREMAKMFCCVDNIPSNIIFHDSYKSLLPILIRKMRKERLKRGRN